ncbi:uncharacterized protein LOC111627203 [Centruroides sculpturatus]|uniref:uncharacterized protein LOC111627203 n=1 Tax=Centruroides sculpturatus TaxID=218467 RepID=UPI000C6E90B2|nr:uncharacterized protein LOC111627203 [Centruroides sculpturatus]
MPSLCLKQNLLNIGLSPSQSITPLILPYVEQKSKNEYKLPTSISRQIIFHQDLTLVIEKKDPDKVQNIQAPAQQIIKKEAARLIGIRRRKMKKHQLRKLRKRMYFVWERRRIKKEMRKERAFREELLAMMKEAEEFDAEKYVADILHTIQNKPHIETKEERIERIRELMRKNRSNTNVIQPSYKGIE